MRLAQRSRSQEAEDRSKKCLCPKRIELRLFSGGSKESDRKYVFATVQTMSRPETLAQFDADEFDYILVDEVHHAAAESYKRVIDHFQPNFMLGMTATPERTDVRTSPKLPIIWCLRISSARFINKSSFQPHRLRYL